MMHPSTIDATGAKKYQQSAAFRYAVIKYMHSWKKYSNIGILFKSGQLSSSTLMRATCIDATSAKKY